MRLLMIAHESPWTAGLKNVLQDEGFPLDRAGTTLSGLNAFNSERHDLVLLEMHASSTADKTLLRSIHQISLVPIIVLANDFNEAKAHIH